MMTNLPQIEIILQLFIAISIFYTFGYKEVKSLSENPTNIKNSIFRLSIMFILGIISLFFYSYNLLFLGDVFYILFLATLGSIVAGWLLYSGGFLFFGKKEEINKGKPPEKKFDKKRVLNLLKHHKDYLRSIM